MNLTIVSNDPIQTHVLIGVAQRGGWAVSSASSLRDLGAQPKADAFLVDVECVDPAVRSELQALALRVGRERVFLLTEEVRDVLPTPEALSVHLLAIKPVHPVDFLRVVQASIPTGHSGTSRRSPGSLRVLA